MTNVITVCSPEDVHVEALLQVAEIFSDLQLAETFTGDEKPSNGTGTVLNKPLPDQVAQSQVWVSDVHTRTLCVKHNLNNTVMRLTVINTTQYLLMLITWSACLYD